MLVEGKALKSNFYLCCETNHIHLLNILNDYIDNFHNKDIVIHTNYKKLEVIKIHFHKNDLPHLLGWDKSSSLNSAKKICDAISKEKITHKSIKKHHRYSESKKRMLQYNFLHEIFFHGGINACVMTMDMKPNNMNLDVVFYEEKIEEFVVLGLRKRIDTGFFVLTTLHTTGKSNCPYNYRRKTRIKFIEWQPKS
ncbi:MULTISPECIES: PBECR4 domain-containing protein [Listeria]|uniref:PBECR4 domain-containing protein n=1 Tax=Listeria TaxID=1637 RepID=UPI0021AB533C|nr:MULTISPECIES: PBECR4 domain-containing protein [Listeria]